MRRNGPAISSSAGRPAGPAAAREAAASNVVAVVPVSDESAAEQAFADLAAHAPPRLHPDLALRLLDVAIAGSLLMLVSPLLALAALAIRVTCGRPVLYRGRRVGRYGRVFTMYKFRTLRPGAEERLGGAYGPTLSSLTEQEVTPIGVWLRASQLDEMPQLWNVVRGDMSVVGPRPVRPAFFAELVRDVPAYWQRLVVRPGLSGFAQTRVTREVPWAEKLAHDLEYVADRSVRLYLRVVAATAWRIVCQATRELLHVRGRR
jgi:lipopolysaccharide/colanic/teichoic acid biosynthesis glycosyltransferase